MMGTIAGATYEVEAPGKVALEYGPISMHIQAEMHGQPYTAAALEGAQETVNVLDNLAKYKHQAAQLIQSVQASQDYPAVLNRLIMAARATREPTVTPMIAVAGTIAEVVAESMIERTGATTVIINNGGDIAVKVEDHRLVRVGVALDIITKRVTHFIPVTKESGIAGICTSGLGGRSFTKGVATAAVAVGPSASIADACATLIGNATLINDPEVEQELAEKIDPLTDIRGQRVTTYVGRLKPESVDKALRQGIAKGREFIELGLLHGVVVVVQDKMLMFPEGIAISR